MVRLTDYGREVHRENFDALGIPFGTLPYRPPTEDAEGWSKWQLWNLMQEFGPHMSLAGRMPFETTIRIVQV